MKGSNEELCNTIPFLLLLMLLMAFKTVICNGADVINTTATFGDGDTLISSGGAFELGFFRPGNSRFKYLGIWYRKVTDFTVVWVANRDSPITDASAPVLKVVPPGILILLNASNSIIWSSNTSSSSPVASSPVAQLLDNGNLVVKEANDDDPENYLWESFNNPTDTLLPGMKFGHLPTGHENYLSSWKSIDDPGTGAYTFHLDPEGYPQNVLKKDSIKLYRSGPWNGLGYSGMTGLRNNTIYSFDLVMTSNAVYFLYEPLSKSTITRFVLNYSGIGQRWAWNDRTHGWDLYLVAPASECDNYDQCHAYGNCALLNSPICKCLDKFIPKVEKDWALMDWSNGCVRRTALALDCNTDGFVRYANLKLPDTRTSRFHKSMTLSECRNVCRRNCTCTAYASLDVRIGGSGCLLWFGDLVDTRQLYHESGQDIFIRVASSELLLDSNRKEGKKVLIASLGSVGGIILVGTFVTCWICKRKKFYLKLTERVAGWLHKEESNELELPSIDLHKICKATDEFSLSNKLGEGGFGPVYKGILEDGQEIAVKRLSKTSFQGCNEFKNEVTCIARLQHRNLVKLLGYCIHGDENMLIYEYMPNKSVDFIIFDDEKSKLLDWPKRFHILTGLARGLLYLHQDSRLRIVHRDLKVSNILLDKDMNPKISDFGLARIFGGNESEANTSRVVGTYGYMSPEYASKGIFSTKLDVFSFGVIVLEILSGQRNRGFSHRGHHHNLLGHAWVLHKDGRPMELVQDSIMESCSMSEVLRSIHVGLLCVQAHPEDRPSMSSVVNMLENDVVLPPPKQPGFFVEEEIGFSSHTLVSTKDSSKNEITITTLDPR